VGGAYIGRGCPARGAEGRAAWPRGERGGTGGGGGVCGAGGGGAMGGAAEVGVMGAGRSRGAIHKKSHQ